MPPSNWGTKLLGMGSVLDELENLSINIGTDAVYVVGSNVSYAVHQEYGTVHQSGQPYLRPAVRDAKARLGKLAKQASSGDDLIKRIALYVERRAKHYVAVDTGTLRASIRAEEIST